MRHKIVIYLTSDTTDTQAEEMLDYLEHAWGFPAEISSVQRYQVEDEEAE